MVSNLIRMNLAMQRKPWSGARIFWLSVGLLLAAGTIALGVTNADNPPLAVDLLASACAAWTLGMALAPVFSGGGGIRAEHFALLPIPPRKLAAGLLGAALVGVLPAVALIAFAALAIFGFMHGIGPGLIGVAVTLLQLIVAVLLARVVHGVMGQAMQTQIGMELVAFYIALLVAMVSVGWFAIEPLTGKRRAWARARRTMHDFAEVLRDLVDEMYPDAEQIVLVVDNLNIHHAAALYEHFEPAEARRIAAKIAWHYTPEHGSWLNIAECYLSTLSRQCLNRRLDALSLLNAELFAWETAHRSLNRFVHWHFATADARTKLHSLYPVVL